MLALLNEAIGRGADPDPGLVAYLEYRRRRNPVWLRLGTWVLPAVAMGVSGL